MHWHVNLSITAIGYLLLILSVVAIYLFCSLTANCVGLRGRPQRRATSNYRKSSKLQS